MKNMFFYLLITVLFCILPVLGQDSSSTIAPEFSSSTQVVTSEGSPVGWMALLLAVLNSNIGTAVASGLVLAALGKLWASKPSWRKLYDNYRGPFFDAVRYAENAIPDGIPNAAAHRADMALKFILKLEGFSKFKEADIKAAIVAAHAEFEEKEIAKSKPPAPVVVVTPPAPPVPPADPTVPPTPPV